MDLYCDLMFISKDYREAWEKHGRNDSAAAYIDLNISDIYESLKEIDNEFPLGYIQKPCISVEDANYRLEIMEELYSNDYLALKIQQSMSLLRNLKKGYIEFNGEKSERQRQYRFIMLIINYIDTMTFICNITEGCISKGLKSLYLLCREIINDAEASGIYARSKELYKKIIEILDIGISINSYENTISIIKCDDRQCISEGLKDEIYDLFDLKTDNYFSIVSPCTMSVLEEKILEVLKNNNEELFDSLSEIYCSNIFIENIEYTIGFKPQLCFYTSYVALLGKFRDRGIPIARPQFSRNSFRADKCMSFSLLSKFLKSDLSFADIIPNNVNLPKGKMFILSGPNQGGKTVFLKCLGSTAFLSKCGCFVFCEKCQIPFYDLIFTHFIRKEIPGRGRLLEELDRLDKAINTFTDNTLVLLNESFASTRRIDGVNISMHYMQAFEKIGCTVGFVSHFYEIPSLYNGGNNNIITLSSEVAESNRRTYVITEKGSKGLAYAHDIAITCEMTYEQLMQCCLKVCKV